MSQKLMLAALHAHCTQLLVRARDELQPECCTISASNSSGHVLFCGGHDPLLVTRQPSPQQQQLWQLCAAQLQHNVLLMLQLARHWQERNVLEGYTDTFEKYVTSR